VPKRRNFRKWLLAVLLTPLVLAGVFLAATWAPDRPVESLKPRWAKPPSTFVALQGMSVHVRDEGPRDDAMPIVLLHGTSSSLHTWEGWAAALRDQRRVIRFDLPGFGLTGPQPEGRYDVATYVSFVRAMLDQLGVKACVLGGNSLGGHIAWQTALVDPRVRALVLVDAGGYPNPQAQLPLGFRLARMPVVKHLAAWSLPRSVIEKSVRNVYGDPGKVTPELIDFYYDMAVRAGNRAALAKRLEQYGPAPAGLVAGVHVPTLILWGGRDRLIPPAHAERFHHDIAGSQVVVFDGLGHVPQEEDPAATVAALRTFLDRTRGGSELMKIKSKDGTEIAFARTGHGPPLVLVHGTTADHTRWAPILPALEKEFTVYAVDRRGRGGSGDAAGYAIEREFEDVAAVVDSIGEPVVLLGHSYGALCSLEASLRTSHLRKLVVYEPPIPTGIELYPPGTVERLQKLLAEGDNAGVVSTFFSEIVRTPPADLSQLQKLPNWPARVAAAHTIPREMVSTVGYRFDAARFKAMKTPTLLLLGGASPPMFKAAIDAVHKALPSSRVVVLAGQQHTAMNTAPELFLREVLGFLRD
jgi:pimeloyl-ACP methyl ester carboxylesterase